MHGTQIPAQEECVKRAHGEYRGERIETFAGSHEARGSEKSLPERTPEIVHITAHDDGSVKVQTRKRVARKKSFKLFGPLGPNQPQVEIKNYEATNVVIVTNVCARAYCSPLLMSTYREIHVLYFAKLKAAQDRITVTASPKAVLSTIGEVGQVQGRAQEFDLVVAERAWHAFGHLLKQQDVWSLMNEHFDDPFEPVSPVEPADPLMDVPRHNTQVGFFLCSGRSGQLAQIGPAS